MPERTSDVDPWARRRDRMIAEQIRSRGVHDRRVLSAMASVPRERFVPPVVRSSAYDDRALPIGCDQTISQPFIVAYMTWQLDVAGHHRVLEVGTGTGYQTAVLALLTRQVFSIERLAALHGQAAACLEELKVPNVTLRVGDGALGLPESAPFDRIMVTAAAPDVPVVLVDQLAEEGVLVMPVGGSVEQRLMRIERHAGSTTETALLRCRFVKLVGNGAWPHDAEPQ